jgi:hypothetical protein
VATLNYSTTVPTSRTVGEVQDILVRAGADAVATRYVDHQPVGLSFMLATAAGVQRFALPVNVEAVGKILTAQCAAGELSLGGKITKTVVTSREHAARVAWRIAKDWLEAQLAIIEAGMVTLPQVMLPYMVVGPNETTVYDEYRARALEAPK